MAQISRYPFLRHLRADTSRHVQLFQHGVRKRSGRGLAFWFNPTGASIAEIPMDDRATTLMLKGQSADFQDLAVQGTVIWRVADAERLGDRVDFTIDLMTGKPAGQPIESIAEVVISLAREFADSHLKAAGVRALLEQGVARLQAALVAGFAGDATLQGMGIDIVAIRVAALTPTSELARALQAPTFEGLQQKADEATFARRAMAVEKERAIAENELGNQIELASRRRDLIAREAENARSEAQATAATRQIAVEAEALAATTGAEAEARRLRLVEQARADMERARMDVYATLPPAILLALAAQEFAGKLQKIDNLTITPDMLSGVLGQIKDVIGQTRGQTGGQTQTKTRGQARTSTDKA